MGNAISFRLNPKNESDKRILDWLEEKSSQPGFFNLTEVIKKAILTAIEDEQKENQEKSIEDWISEAILLSREERLINSGFYDLRKEFDEYDREGIHKKALEWFGQYPDSNPIRDSKHYSWYDDHDGVYFASDISGPNSGQYVYDVVHPVTGKVVKAPANGWRYPEATMLEKIENDMVHFGIDETTVPKDSFIWI